MISSHYSCAGQNGVILERARAPAFFYGTLSFREAVVADARRAAPGSPVGPYRRELTGIIRFRARDAPSEAYGQAALLPIWNG